MIIRWGYTTALTLLALLLVLAIWIYWIRTHSLQFRELPDFFRTAVSGSVQPAAAPLPGPLRFFDRRSEGLPRYELWHAPYRGRWRLAAQSDLDRGTATKYTVALTPAEMHELLRKNVYDGTALNAFLWPSIFSAASFVGLVGLGLGLDIRRRVRLLSYGGIQTLGRREVSPEQFTKRARKTDFVFLTTQPIQEEEE